MVKKKMERLFKQTPEIRQQGAWEKIEEHLKEVYGGSPLIQMLDKQAEAGGSEAALFTDIDNTFHRVGHEGAMNELFDGMTKGQSMPIIAITGADFDYVEGRVRSGIVPRFTAIAGTVGTDLRILHENSDGTFEYKRDLYFEKMLREGGYDRKKISADADQFINDMNAAHPDWRMEFQNADRERGYIAGTGEALWEFKVGMDFFASPGELDGIGEELDKRFPGLHLVIHEELAHNQHRRQASDGERRMYCINILPIGKSGTVQYLSKLTGIKKGMVAGDSGNDIAMLTESGELNAILVGGHTMEAAEKIGRAIKGRKNGKRSFQRIVGPDGVERAIYIEPEGSKLKGAESIIRAATILRRAENIKKIRAENKLKGR